MNSDWSIQISGVPVICKAVFRVEKKLTSLFDVPKKCSNVVLWWSMRLSTHSSSQAWLLN